jgi:hypothetical protein
MKNTIRESRAFRDDGTYTPLAEKLVETLRENLEESIELNWRRNSKNITKSEFKEIFDDVLFFLRQENPVIGPRSEIGLDS